ncbi:MAG: S9 family peptidase [Bacteroidales bacterium]
MQKLLSVLTALALSASLFADSLTVNRWLLVHGPDLIFPAFAETENPEGEPFTIKKLFNETRHDISGYYPQENKVFLPGKKTGSKWSVKHADEEGFISIDKSDRNANATVFLAAYIETERWMKAKLEIRGRQMMEFHLNGELLGTKSTNETAGDDPGKWTREIDLTPGKHLLLIRTIHSHDDHSQWKINGRINLPEYADISDVGIEMHPMQGKNIHHLLDGIKAGSARLSSDGKYYAVNFSRTLPPSDRSENWLEIKRVNDGKLVQSFRHATTGSFSWAPEGNVFSYRTTREGKATIWLYDIDRGSYRQILEDMENMGSYSWSPDGSYIVYSLKEEYSDDDDNLKRILGMQDRLPGYRDRNFLYRVDLNTGLKERLTHGFLSTSLHDISPCSKKILFSQSRPDYLERPYSKQDLFIMDIETREVDTLFKDMRWSVSGQFSPDGEQILFTGGPSAFGKPGENLPEGMIANNYDTQAYIHDLKSGNTDPITREFDPSVLQVAWSSADNNIYIVAGEEDFVHLFRYNTGNRRFTKIDTGRDVLSWFRLADNEPLAVFSGSGMSSPPLVSLLNLENGNYRELENPEKDTYRHVVFGENMEWEFKNHEGVTISGRVYLPPGFDESEKYPLIVYYYGGTSPVSRSFGGRYPFNMYAANGYVVYVLQPSGATGFGQEFSAMHVNNWGRTVADEILLGTRLFLEEHPFADPERVGCMGASYGGFMTMLLQTLTDMFAAAISHAGISSISSYWGEGYWGYSYSAEAGAGSFPWNNRELYVDQSPLFSADKITTPLLLLHGTSDTNVPPGESIQLYTALKLLGRPVEMVEIKGENHHILTYGKRIEWSNTKLAWFDRWLKNQPQWWEDLYPEKNL